MTFTITGANLVAIVCFALFLAGVFLFVREFYRRKQPKTLWLVGQYKGGKAGAVVWEFQGVFTTRQAALGACIDRTYFLGPVPLDKPFPREGADWPGVVYPLVKEA